jgi:hypothetical protein
MQVVDASDAPINSVYSVAEQFQGLSTNTCGTGAPVPSSCSPLNAGGTFLDTLSVSGNLCGSGIKPSSGCGFSQTSVWSLALIGNASGADCGGGAGSRSEAFSIRRLGGSRWRLRRTRCAMGFERQPGSEQSLGRAMRPGGNAIRMVGVATEMSKSARGKLHERQWRSIGHTRASACRSTSSGR